MIINLTNGQKPKEEDLSYHEIKHRKARWEGEKKTFSATELLKNDYWLDAC